MHEYNSDPDPIKLYWQVEALKGQIAELERERERLGNLLWLMRRVLLRSLRGLGAGPIGKKSESELLTMMERRIALDWRFSPCPNAEEYHCRPIAMQMTRDGDLVRCDDCGWDIRDAPPPASSPPRPPNEQHSDKSSSKEFSESPPSEAKTQ